MEVGETFRSLSDNDPDGHLWVIVAKNENSELVCFNISTLRAHSDKTCIIEAGEHDFIKHISVVYYAQGLVFSKHKLDQKILNDYATGFISDALLQKIQQGALDSEETPQKLQSLVQDYLNR